MLTSKHQVVPTPELLSEMQELEVFGGTASDDIHIHAVVGCNITYSGNCVTQCACPPKKETDKDNKEINPNP
jgi:hypothetical protein